MSIIAGGVCSHDVKRSSGMNHPVAGNVVVIADVGKATGTVVTTLLIYYNTCVLFYKVLKMKTLKIYLLCEWNLVRGFLNFD